MDLRGTVTTVPLPSFYSVSDQQEITFFNGAYYGNLGTPFINMPQVLVPTVE